MASSETFLAINDKGEGKCLLCDYSIKEKKVSEFKNEGWPALKEKALRWFKIKISFDDEKHCFTKVHKKIEDCETAFGKAHATCRTSFRTMIERCEKKYGLIEEDGDVSDGNGTNEQTAAGVSRRSVSQHLKKKRLCFVCNDQRESDGNAYNQGGLGRCTEGRAAKRILERKDEFLKYSEHRFFPAANRLQLLTSGESHDVFAADIYYHQSCYLKFAVNAHHQQEEIDNDNRDLGVDVMNEFYGHIRMKVLREKNAYLLSDLLRDIINMSEERGIEPPVNHTCALKKKIGNEFPERIGFYSTVHQVIVYSNDMNPLDYTAATIKGHGLRDDDLIRACAKMIKRKLDKKRKEDDFCWPYTPDEVIKKLDSGPVQHLYNLVYATIDPTYKINEYGYAITTSRPLATKIWSLVSDWESLVLKKHRNVKQLVSGLTLHRFTSSRQSIDMLHKMGNCISYNDIRIQNQAWARMVSANSNISHSMAKGIATHAMIDNNDWCQDTVTGAGTTHDTNCTLFQPLLADEVFEPESLPERNLDLLADSEDELEAIPEFHIGARKAPNCFPTHKDDDKRDLLDRGLKRDVAWALLDDLPGRTEEIDFVGSWTAFNKAVTEVDTRKSLLEYMPVIPEPPEYHVCKAFLENLLNLMRELEIGHVFAHADEQVYARLAHILWKYPNVYRRVVILMGGFHQLRVRQKLIYKRHACKGYKSWWIDAGAIAEGSADKAAEGGHYYRNMRLHKETFNALIQFRTRKITCDYEEIGYNLIQLLQKLRSDPSSETVRMVLEDREFNVLYSKILHCVDGTECQMTVAYLKDVSSLLALVSAVRECDLELHLQAEREMVKHCFAFDHVNYARYMSFQHVYLRDLERRNDPAFTDLKHRGFGGSLSGGQFSNIHGDMITEVFNGETKRNAGPFRAGYSTNLSSINTWIKTTHTHAKLQSALREKINMSTSSVHKELTPSGKKMHVAHVTALKEKLSNYKIDPFADGPARHITTGSEIDQNIIKGLLNAPSLGNDKYLEFVEQRLITGKVDFFQPIKKIMLPTGLKKAKKVPKALTVLKQDRQAFGAMLSKSIDLHVAFKYPLTELPLSIATPEGELRQTPKNPFRNFLVEESNSITNSYPKNGRWLTDGMAAMRSVKARETYREWLIALLNFVTPPPGATPLSIEIVNDTYHNISEKSGTRLKRGETLQRTYIQAVEQKMLKGNSWACFFNHIDNKRDLIRLAANYFRSQEGRSHLKVPFIFTEEERVWKINSDDAFECFQCNHEEADTRLVLHACLRDTCVIVVAKDTDVLVLLVHAYAIVKPASKWFMKIDHEKYVDIGKVFDFLGENLAMHLPQIHAISGCDTTSFFFGVSKVKLLKKIMKHQDSLNLLSSLGEEKELSVNDMKNIVKFVQTMMYSGREDESLVDTRVRLYKAMKTKASQSLPPDPDSMQQAIMRMHYQVYYWLKFAEKSIPSISLEDNGWTVDVEKNTVRPVWFTGKQIPLLLSKASADQQSQPASPAPKRRRTRTLKRTKITQDGNLSDPESEEELSIEMSDESRELEYIFFGDSSSSESEIESDEFDWMP